MRQRRKLLVNGLANLIAGLSSAVLTILLPAFLARCLDRADFALWMLLFPLASYFSFVGLGFQVSLSRFIASHSRPELRHLQPGLMRIAIWLTSGLSVLVLGGFGVATLLLGDIFPSLPRASLTLAGLTLMGLSVANAIQLPLSMLGATFVGAQQNSKSAVLQLLTRIVIAVAASAAALQTRNLLFVAAAYLGGTLLAALLQSSYFRRYSPLESARPATGVSPAAAELMPRKAFLAYSLSLSLWSLVSLALVALPTTIVGVVDYPAIAGFSMASGLLAFLVGIYNALVTPLTQSVAAQYGDDSGAAALHHLLRRYSFISATFLLVAGAWLIYLFDGLLTLWVGPRLASEAAPFAVLLTLANVIRNLQGPLAVFIIGTGKQARVMWLPLAEATLATVLGIGLGRAYGAVGVALALALASVVGALVTAMVATPLALGATFRLPPYLREAFWMPLLTAAPLLIVLLACMSADVGKAAAIALLLLATASTGLLAARHWRRAPAPTT